MELNVILEPMDHFTQEDESFLQKLISKKKKGESFRAVVLKNDMKLIGEEVMKHWYGIKGKDYLDYMNRYFDEKWNAFDARGKDQIDIDEADKFIREFISGMVQL